MGSQRSSLARLLIFILPTVVCDDCWIARTGQTEWCNGYCCDTPINGWGCCCDEGNDVQMIALGVFAIILWTLGVILYVVKKILCYIGRDLFSELNGKIKRRIAKWRKNKEEHYSRQLAEEKQFRRLFKENISEIENEDWRKLVELYSLQEDEDDETGHEVSCLCCDRYRISFNKV